VAIALGVSLAVGLAGLMLLWALRGDGSDTTSAASSRRDSVSTQESTQPREVTTTTDFVNYDVACGRARIIAGSFRLGASTAAVRRDLEGLRMYDQVFDQLALQRVIASPSEAAVEQLMAESGC
jgi:hypothetical protein